MGSQGTKAHWELELGRALFFRALSFIWLSEVSLYQAVVLHRIEPWSQWSPVLKFSHIKGQMNKNTWDRLRYLLGASSRFQKYYLRLLTIALSWSEPTYELSLWARFRAHYTSIFSKNILFWQMSLFSLFLSLPSSSFCNLQLK